MKHYIDALENPVTEFLLTLKSIKEDIRDGIDELEESGQTLRKDKRQKENVAAWKAARETLKTALEELDEVYATILLATPQYVQDEVGDDAGLDTSPDAIQQVQMEMKAYLEQVESSPARMACEAACSAADVMFRTQITTVEQTHDAIVDVAAKAREMAFQSAMLVYRDTCMQALEACHMQGTGDMDGLTSKIGITKH